MTEYGKKLSFRFLKSNNFGKFLKFIKIKTFIFHSEWRGNSVKYHIFEFWCFAYEINWNQFFARSIYFLKFHQKLVHIFQKMANYDSYRVISWRFGKHVSPVANLQILSSKVPIVAVPDLTPRGNPSMRSENIFEIKIVKSSACREEKWEKIFHTCLRIFSSSLSICSQVPGK
jgi:hypothetical protein